MIWKNNRSHIQEISRWKLNLFCQVQNLKDVLNDDAKLQNELGNSAGNF